MNDPECIDYQVETRVTLRFIPHPEWNTIPLLRADQQRFAEKVRDIFAQNELLSQHVEGDMKFSFENGRAYMKAVNAYYRKHKTLEGCPHISEDVAQKLKSGMENTWSTEKKPYPSWALSNNNAEIRRVKERIATLTRQQEQGYSGWEFDGGTVEANTSENRLQIFFAEKPDEETRSTLKSNGFRWSPKAGAWQRQLNDNAIYAAGRIDCIKPVTGESPSELQKRVRLEREIASAPIDDTELVAAVDEQEDPEQDQGMHMG